MSCPPPTEPPPNTGNPSTATSSRRPSAAMGAWRSRSRNSTFVATSLSADTGHHTLQRKPPPPQDPSPCAGSAVMAINIEWAATPARTHGQREGELKATQQLLKPFDQLPLGNSCTTRRPVQQQTRDEQQQLPTLSLDGRTRYLAVLACDMRW